jgi:Trypsin-co-occurring domain 1
MSPLLDLGLEQGGSILVEVEQTEGSGPVMRGSGRPAETVVEAGQTLESVMGRLGPAVRGIVSELRSAADWPDEVEIEFGIKLSTEANVVIARAGGEANFRICLRWAHPAES